jgi:hypothetical protein
MLGPGRERRGTPGPGPGSPSAHQRTPGAHRGIATVLSRRGGPGQSMSTTVGRPGRRQPLGTCGTVTAAAALAAGGHSLPVAGRHSLPGSNRAGAARWRIAGLAERRVAGPSAGVVTSPDSETSRLTVKFSEFSERPVHLIFGYLFERPTWLEKQGMRGALCWQRPWSACRCLLCHAPAAYFQRVECV